MLGDWLSWVECMIAVVLDVVFQKWRMRHLPDLGGIGGSVEGQIIIVTGPTSGIGKDTAAELSRRGAHVVLACRNTRAGEAYKAELKAAAVASGAAKPSLEVQQLDLASLASVRGFARRWLESGQPVHCLVNNAGLFSMGSKGRALTADGFEMHFGTNFLGPFLLTLLLLPAIRKGAHDDIGKAAGGARVVNVSSKLHTLGRIDFGNLQLAKGYTPLRAYGASKLAQVVCTRELRAQLPQGSDIHVMALHPGNALTDVSRTIPGWMQRLQGVTMRRVLLSPAEGARATVFCATAATAGTLCESGEVYFDSDCRPTMPSDAAQNGRCGEELWEVAAELCGVPADVGLHLTQPMGTDT